jgi:hypothetical protein
VYQLGVTQQDSASLIPKPYLISSPLQCISGRGGIRTHGEFPHARFRVECLKPDSATLPWFEKNVEPAYAKSFGVASAERPASNIEPQTPF